MTASVLTAYQHRVSAELGYQDDKLTPKIGHYFTASQWARELDFDLRPIYGVAGASVCLLALCRMGVAAEQTVRSLSQLDALGANGHFFWVASNAAYTLPLGLWVLGSSPPPTELEAEVGATEEPCCPMADKIFPLLNPRELSSKTSCHTKEELIRWLNDYGVGTEQGWEKTLGPFSETTLQANIGKLPDRLWQKCPDADDPLYEVISFYAPSADEVATLVPPSFEKKLNSDNTSENAWQRLNRWLVSLDLDELGKWEARFGKVERRGEDKPQARARLLRNIKGITHEVTNSTYNWLIERVAVDGVNWLIVSSLLTDAILFNAQFPRLGLLALATGALHFRPSMERGNRAQREHTSASAKQLLVKRNWQMGSFLILGCLARQIALNSPGPGFTQLFALANTAAVIPAIGFALGPYNDSFPESLCQLDLP